MRIYLFFSNKKKNRKREEAMDEDEARDIDLRRKSPEKNRDLRNKISSTVVKIKTEKGEEDRRKKAVNRTENRTPDEDRRIRRREQQDAIHEARPRQRSERRPDRIDQEDRRRLVFLNNKKFHFVRKNAPSNGECGMLLQNWRT